MYLKAMHIYKWTNVYILFRLLAFVLYKYMKLIGKVSIEKKEKRQKKTGLRGSGSYL